MAYIITAIDNNTDFHTVAKFMRHIDTNKALGNIKLKSNVAQKAGLLQRPVHVVGHEGDAVRAGVVRERDREALPRNADGAAGHGRDDLAEGGEHDLIPGVRGPVGVTTTDRRQHLGPLQDRDQVRPVSPVAGRGAVKVLNRGVKLVHEVGGLALPGALLHLVEGHDDRRDQDRDDDQDEPDLDDGVAPALAARDPRLGGEGGGLAHVSFSFFADGSSVDDVDDPEDRSADDGDKSGRDDEEDHVQDSDRRLHLRL